jgi:hypothetical protein
MNYVHLSPSTLTGHTFAPSYTSVQIDRFIHDLLNSHFSITLDKYLYYAKL